MMAGDESHVNVNNEQEPVNDINQGPKDLSVNIDETKI